MKSNLYVGLLLRHHLHQHSLHTSDVSCSHAAPHLTCMLICSLSRAVRFISFQSLIHGDGTPSLLSVFPSYRQLICISIS